MGKMRCAPLGTYNLEKTIVVNSVFQGTYRLSGIAKSCLNKEFCLFNAPNIPASPYICFYEGGVTDNM